MLLTLEGDGYDHLRHQSAQLMRPTSRLSTEEKLALLSEIASGEKRFLADYSGLLETFLDDSATEVRLAAIRLLWEYPEPRFTERLITHASDDPSLDVRLAAIEVLGRHIYEGELSEEPVDEGGWEAISAPVRTAGQRATEFLLRLHTDPSRSLAERRRALEVLGFSRHPAVHDLIEAAYHSGDRELRLSAIVAMGHGSELAWKELILNELESPDLSTRIEAVRAAGELRLLEAVPVLARNARRNNIPRSLRLWSIFALGQTGAPTALNLLERLSVASDPEIAETARAALDEWYYANNADDYDQELV